MVRNQSEEDKNQMSAARLLSRGGRILGLAALAHARGQRAGFGPWYALCPETIAATEEVLHALDQRPDPKLLEAVVRAAMAPAPATAAPRWAEPLWRDPRALSRVGAAVDSKYLAPALGIGRHDLSDRLRGLAALAVALSRSLDGLCALAEHLPQTEKGEIVRMASLAAAVVNPGEPTQMKAKIRRILKEEQASGQDH